MCNIFFFLNTALVGEKEDEEKNEKKNRIIRWESLGRTTWVKGGEDRRRDRFWVEREGEDN